MREPTAPAKVAAVNEGLSSGAGVALGIFSSRTTETVTVCTSATAAQCDEFNERYQLHLVSIQCVLGVVTCYLAALLGRRIAGSVAVGNLAALLIGLFIPAVYYDGTLEKTTLCLVLSTGALICAILMLVDHRHAQRAVTLSWTVGVPAGTALALLAVRYRKWLCRGRLGRVLGPPLEAIGVVGQIVASPRRHGAAAFTGMAVYWAGEVFVLWVCLAAFTRDTPSVTAVVVGYATGYALTRRTLPLAGAGAVEALLPFALTWVGFGLPAAVLAVFCYRVFNLWLPLGPAAAALYALQRRAPEDRGR